MTTGSSGINNGEESSNRHACAACKHQRKKCKKDCVLAPFFPSSKVEDFELLLTVFGVCKLTKMLSRVAESHREEAVRSLMWEARAWVQNPVLGPLGLFTNINQENEMLRNTVKQLHQQIQYLSYAAVVATPLNPGLVGGTTTVHNEAMFNQNWGPGSVQMSNYTGFVQEEDNKNQVANCIGAAPQYNNTGVNNIAASQNHGNTALQQFQGRDFHGGREQGSGSSGSSRVLEGENQEQRGGFVAQGYGHHHYHHGSSSSSFQGISQGRGSANGDQQNYVYNQLPPHQQRRQIQQQQQQQQHMSNTQRR